MQRFDQGRKGFLKDKTAKSVGMSGPSPLFATQAAWAAWLETNHRQSAGVWLRIAKKRSGLRSVTYAEALEVALCYGWIDGQKRGESDAAWLQRFLPRSAKSIWSKINRDKVVALIANGRMKTAGLEAIDAAKKCGTWDAAYDSPKAANVPTDFQTALDASPRAREFFQSLDGANRYAVLFRIQTVKKAETRERKIREFVEMLNRKETIHPPKKSRGPSK
jgi:uncharacterized protein YdeI (YjbR/CyaY-like superfamily)